MIEEAKAVESLVEEYGSAERGRRTSPKEQDVGLPPASAAELTPDLQEATRRGDLAIREARSLARVPLEQQVVRWNAARDDRGGADTNREPGEGGAESGPDREPPAPPLRSVVRAMRKFDTEPNALAVALHDQLGETGARTLLSHLRKLLK